MKKSETAEVVNDLLGYDGIKIIQRPDMFSFSLDSTLLADFVQLSSKVRTIMDFGTGFAPIPLFLSLKTNQKIIGVEIQPEVADLAKRNIALNNLAHQIEIIEEDIKNLPQRYPPNSIDLITCNPLFFKYVETSNINDSTYKTIARHEVKIDLDNLIKTAKILLKTGGRFFMVHRAERLSEIMQSFSNHKFNIKRLRFVHPRQGQNANMVLIEASNNAQPGAKILPPIYVHHAEGYTDEILKIFNYGRK